MDAYTFNPLFNIRIKGKWNESAFVNPLSESNFVSENPSEQITRESSSILIILLTMPLIYKSS